MKYEVTNYIRSGTEYSEDEKATKTAEIDEIVA